MRAEVAISATKVAVQLSKGGLKGEFGMNQRKMIENRREDGKGHV